MARTIRMRNPIHNAMVDTFHKWYMAEKALPFIWTAKEMAQIDNVYKSLVRLCAATGSARDGGAILTLWERMLDGLRAASPWVYQNASPAVISSKFNEIVCALRGGVPALEPPGYVQAKLSIIEDMLK